MVQVIACTHNLLFDSTRHYKIAYVVLLQKSQKISLYLSTIQKIGLYLLYNTGVKIERGKQASRNEKILDSAKGTERKHTMKKNAGYVINYEDNTITLTKAFAKQAQNPATKEFRELDKLHKNFPDFTITKRTAKVNEDKERHAGLSIPWMTNYIKTYIKDEAAVAEFEEVKNFYRGMSGYYGKVKGWFLNKYPNY